jgi:hypothetical protein
MKPLIIGALAGLLALVAYGAQSDIRVPAGDSFALKVLGATAAYAIDTNVADATAANGVVTFVGRSPGTTQAVVITPSATLTYRVTVPMVAAPRVIGIAPGSTSGNYGSRYSTADGLLYSTLAVNGGEESKRSEMRLTAVNGQGSASLRFFTYRLIMKRRQVTLFDEQIDNSPLTVNSVTLRGLHWQEGALSLHAGVVSTAMIRSFLIPVERQSAIGGSYAFERSVSATITPSFYFYPGRGAVASLMYDYHPSENMHARVEAGFSRRVGASAELNWNRIGERLSVEIKRVPRQFVSINASDVRGTLANASWNRLFGRRLTIDSAVSRNAYALPKFSQRSFTASGNAHYALTDRLSVTTGATYGAFGGAGHPSHTMTVPAGLSFESARFGASAIPQWTQSYSSNRGGLGIRASAHASAGGLQFSVYADRQNDVPTVEAIFNARPDLALAFEQLGLVASSPEDIVRLIQENASLIGLGILNGLTVNIAPVRLQTVVEASWLGRGPAAQQVRLRIIRNRTEDVAMSHTSTIANLLYARSLNGSMDVFAGLSSWRTQASNRPSVTLHSIEVGVRGRFSALPNLSSWHRSGTISGIVFTDDALTGIYQTGMAGLAGVEVELDGAQKTVTDHDGHYSFVSAAGGRHRITARLKNRAAYFTTPSTVTVDASRRVDFGTSELPARLVGHVRNDTGHNVAGVTVILSQGEKTLTVVTEGDGKFSLTVVPGDYEARIDGGSLPAGYQTREASRRLTLDRAVPVSLEFVLVVNRSVSGRVSMGPADVEIRSLGRKTSSTIDGMYAFRSLPPGEITIVAHRGDVTATRTVTVPEEPATLVRIDLAPDRNSSLTRGEPKGAASTIGRNSASAGLPVLR